MSLWDALAAPMEDRPGDTYTRSVKRRVRVERATARPATKPKTDAEPFLAAALVAKGDVARLVPITVVDFYHGRTA